MRSVEELSFHSAGDEWLASYAAGSLSSAKSLLIACQADIQPRLQKKLDGLDEIAGAFIESATSDALSDDFTHRLSDALNDVDRRGLNDDESEQPQISQDDWAPGPLKAMLDASGGSIKWKKAAPGVERADLDGVGGERLYLLKVRGGMTMPLHSHAGEEWSLILQGGYHVGDVGYGRGDLHCEDSNCVHQPVIDDDGVACISLVVDEGPVRFSNPVLRFLQPLIGI